MLRLILGVLACLTVITTASADVVTYFNFNNNTSVANLLTPTSGSSVLTTNFSANGVGSFNGSTVNALNLDPAGASLSLIADASNVNNGKTITFQFSTTGFTDLGLSFATQRTSTGFNSNQLAYSTDGTAFTSFGGPYVPASSFALQSFDLSSITAIDDVANAYLRITFNGATSSAGNNRIDNVQITGTPLSVVPLPPAFLAGGALLGVTGLGRLLMRRPAA